MEKIFVPQRAKVCGTVQKVCQSMSNYAKLYTSRYISDILHRFSTDWHTFAHFSTLCHSLAQKAFSY